jgi:hypothetical protein
VVLMVCVGVDSVLCKRLNIWSFCNANWNRGLWPLNSKKKLCRSTKILHWVFKVLLILDMLEMFVFVHARHGLILVSLDSDVNELISMLADSQGECSIVSSCKLDGTDFVCPSRVHAMLASRACQMSTMIGDPLTKAEMKKVIPN